MIFEEKSFPIILRPFRGVLGVKWGRGVCSKSENAICEIGLVPPLNKQEFRDAVSLRYGWRIPNTPQYCGCGKLNDVNHTMICAKGGYTFMRHNALRDMNVDLQSEVCKDVVTEPSLIPVNNEEITGTKADRAHPDISSRGLWSTFQRTFFDVRVMHLIVPPINRQRWLNYMKNTKKRRWSNTIPE